MPAKRPPKSIATTAVMSAIVKALWPVMYSCPSSSRSHSFETLVNSRSLRLSIFWKLTPDRGAPDPQSKAGESGTLATRTAQRPIARLTHAACSEAGHSKSLQQETTLQSFSKRLYRLRWRIQNAFNRLKASRRIATRYDRLALITASAARCRTCMVDLMS